MARQAADIILLASDLGVLADGVAEGRRTYANIMKYIRMGTSSNFGNMLSMALASLFLPFLPLAPLQILLNNLIYDVSEIGIPFDAADPEDLPGQGLGTWDILRFTLIMGPLSSVFDILTFAFCDRVSTRMVTFPDGLVRRVDRHADPRHFHHPHGGAVWRAGPIPPLSERPLGGWPLRSPWH